jgi:hypothetical protein
MSADDSQISFHALSHFPLPSKPIFGIPRDELMQQIPTIDDIIKYNLHSMVPHVDLGLHNDRHTPDEIQEWIEMAKLYGSAIINRFYHNIFLQERKLQYILRQRDSCLALSIPRVKRLPYDMVRYIRGFLLPETRILYYLDEYTNIGDLVKRMPNECLKRFYRAVVYKQYFEGSNNFRSNYRNYPSCLPANFSIRLNPPNKKGYSDEINYLIASFRNTAPFTPESYMHFQTRALRLIQSVVYIAVHLKPWLSKSRSGRKRAT